MASLHRSQESVFFYRHGKSDAYVILIFYGMLTGLCPDWENWDPRKPVDNAREAMQQADDWLGVPQVCTSAYLGSCMCAWSAALCLSHMQSCLHVGPLWMSLRSSGSVSAFFRLPTIIGFHLFSFF